MKRRSDARKMRPSWEVSRLQKIAGNRQNIVDSGCREQRLDGPQRREVIESITRHARFTSTSWLGALFYRLFREYGNGIAWPCTPHEIVTPKISSDLTGTFDNLLKRTKHSLLQLRLYQCSWLRVVQARHEEPRGGSRG